MNFDRWNTRKVLVAIGALPFVIGMTTLISMLANFQETRIESLVAVAVIFGVGYFLVSLRRSIEIDTQCLIKRWHVFFALKKEVIVSLKQFSHIDVEAAIATHGMGSVSSSTGQSTRTKYYRIRLVGKAGAAEDYFISEHILLERKKDISKCIEVVKEVAKLTALDVKYGEQVIQDVKEYDASMLSGIT